MCSIPKVRLPLSTGTDFDFEGGDITSDAGVILVNEFCTAIGLQEALRKHLEAHPMREYDDWRVAYQRVIMLVAGYLRDVDAERLDRDPAFAHVLGSVASQPTLSRRLSSMGESDGELLRLAIREVQRNVARVAPGREFVVVDVDSTLAPAASASTSGCARAPTTARRGRGPSSSGSSTTLPGASPGHGSACGATRASRRRRSTWPAKSARSPTPSG